MKLPTNIDVGPRGWRGREVGTPPPGVSFLHWHTGSAGGEDIEKGPSPRRKIQFGAKKCSLLHFLRLPSRLIFTTHPRRLGGGGLRFFLIVESEGRKLFVWISNGDKHEYIILSINISSIAFRKLTQSRITIFIVPGKREREKIC